MPAGFVGEANLADGWVGQYLNPTAVGTDMFVYRKHNPLWRCRLR